MWIRSPSIFGGLEPKTYIVELKSEIGFPVPPPWFVGQASCKNNTMVFNEPNHAGACSGSAALIFKRKVLFFKIMLQLVFSRQQFQYI